MRSTPPNEAQNLAEAGKTAYKKKDFKNAARFFGEAASGYAGSKDALMEAEMRNNQGIALLMAKQPEAALQVMQDTYSVFTDAGDQRRAGMALANCAAALEELKRLDEAEQWYARSAACLEACGEKDLLADVLRSQAALQTRRGKVTQAAVNMQESMRNVEKPSLRQKILKKILFMRLWR